MAKTDGNGEPQPGVTRVIWLGACLFSFGSVIGVMAALSEQVGTTSALIAALFTLVGGSLSALYRPPDLSEEARDWIVQAAGLICLGLLVGLGTGFWLRYYDQAHLMTAIVRERAALDRELIKHGQRWADLWGESKDKADGGGKNKALWLPVPKMSITLREGVEELSQAALKELNGAIARIDTQEGIAEEQERMKRLKSRVQTYRDVIQRPKDYSPAVWLAHVELAAEAMAELHEGSAEKLLRELREEAVQP